MQKLKFSVLLMLAVTASLFAGDVVTQPFNGVTRIHRTLTSPRPLNINILRIDLDAPGVGFAVTPSNGSATGDATPMTCTQFLSQSKAQIAINCGFFNMTTYDVLGYTASNGDAYSDFVDYNQWEYWPTPFVALNLSIDNVPTMITPGAPMPTKLTNPLMDTWNAVPGSEWIVRDGVKVVDNGFAVNPGLNPKTIAGYTQDRSELILVTIDGRQSGFSEGMTTSEAADFLISLGVYQGINFDGGGSTTMAFADPTPYVVNSPSGGTQRIVANHLGVYTNGVPDPQIKSPIALRHISFEDNFGGADYIDDQGSQAGDIQFVAGGPAGKAGDFVNPRIVNSSGDLTGGLGDALSFPYEAADSGTVCMYLNIDDWHNYMTLFDINGGPDAAGNIWKSYVETDGDLLVRISGWDAGVNAESIVGTNSWFHYALAWEKDGSNVNYRIYLNGDLAYTHTQSWVDSGSMIYLGAAHPWNPKYDGLMDEAYVFDLALNSVQLGRLINSIESGNIAADPRPFAGAKVFNANQALSWEAPANVVSP